MIAKIKIWVNEEEYTDAKESALPLPEKVYTYREFGFRLDDVDIYYVSKDGKDLIIYMKEFIYCLQFDPKIHEILNTKFKN